MKSSISFNFRTLLGVVSHLMAHNTHTLRRIFGIARIHNSNPNESKLSNGRHYYSSSISSRSLQNRNEDPGNNLSMKETIDIFCKEGRLEEAVEILQLMNQRSISADPHTYALLVQACIKAKALSEGKRVHSHMLDAGFKPLVFLGDRLLEMYTKCGSVLDARQIFDNLPFRDAFSWNMMVSAYVKCGSVEEARELFDKMPERGEISWNSMIVGYVRSDDCKEALKLFWQMQLSGMKTSDFIFAIVLNACGNLSEHNQGKRIHASMIKFGCDVNVFLLNALVDMYGKCGIIEDARQVFDKMIERDVVSWNTIVSGYARQGFGEETIRLFWQMHQTGMKPNQFTYASVLTACTSLLALELGKQVHAGVIRTGFGSGAFVGSALVDMYAKCGSIGDAQHVFDETPERDIVTWTGMIAGYAQNGLGEEALKLFFQMQQAGIKPDQVTFASVLSACVSSGSINNARDVFNKMPARNAVSWNAMIAVYVQNEHDEEALKLFLQMQRAGMKPTQSTFASILSACVNLLALEWGIQIHAKTIRTGLESNIFVGSALVNMYAKCGSITDARTLFDTLSEYNEVSWNAIMSGYIWNGFCEEALKLFCQMQHSGIVPDQVAYSSVLRACASLAGLEQGKQVHAMVITTGFQSNIFVRNALVDMYAKCECIEDAQRQFERLPERDTVSWNAMIVGNAQNGYGEDALDMFFKMLLANVKPDEVSFTSVLNACTSLAALGCGKQVHNYIIKSGFELNAFVCSALVDMYAKCGSMKCAEQVLGKMPEMTVVSWNAIIAGYAQNNNGEKALKIFCQMQQLGMRATQFTFASVLVACSSLLAVEQGKQVHGQIVKTGFESNVFVGSALIDMYAKCESIGDACQLFNKMPERNAVTWTAMTAGYAQRGHDEKALKLFWQMKARDVKPDHATFASILRACSNLAALQHGRLVHGHMIQSAFESNVYAGSALVDMYAKCGSIEDACQVFSEMPNKDIVSWNAMIVGYAQNGYGMNALQLFEQMLQASMKPDYITFIGVLSACSHAGLIDEGRHYFGSMINDHCIQPKADHYACLIDLLGRAGQLDEAREIIDNLPFKPDAVMWGSLLAACRIHGNKELGKQAAESLIELGPQNSAPYVMLSNIYAAAGKWEDVKRMRKLMKDTGVKKKPACSWIEVKNRVHAFIAEEKSHTQTNEI